MVPGPKTPPQAKDEASGKAEHGDDVRIAKAESHPRNTGITNALSQLGGQYKAFGLEEREALEMAMLISFVNKQAPGTARVIEMHLPASFCNVTSSTVSRDRMSRKKAINCSLLARIRVKA